VIRAFISGKLLGADPGMAGITRVGRMPGFANGKAKYGGWQVALRSLTDVAYSVEELLTGFGLQIVGRQVPLKKLPTEEALERNRLFATMYKFLKDRGQLKRDEPDPSGWTEMSCPWLGGHTGSVDNGAAIREPDPENNWTGAFRCHHGTCIERGWKDLMEWINEQATEELAVANQCKTDEFGGTLK
jgi:hypothetical protein